MTETNSLSKFASKANATFNSITANSTGITNIAIGSVTINPSQINTGTANLVFGNNTVIIANGAFGANGQVLTSDGTVMYWGSGGGGGPYIKLSSNTTVATFSSYLADTSNGSIYIDLPASPAVGDRVAIADGGGDKIANPAFIQRNGSTISGVANNLSFDVPNIHAEFVYDGSTWRVFT